MSALPPANRFDVRGLDLDPQSRCAHWHSPLDIVALQLRCCAPYWACRDCHDALAGHAAQVWPKAEWHAPAVLCGACGTTMSIAAYLASDDRCPTCAAPFNPGCKRHRHLYFEG
jgi:uncharacterized CHY-type Zn-finger protein